VLGWLPGIGPSISGGVLQGLRDLGTDMRDALGIGPVRVRASGTPDLTRSGDVVGTLRYLAPERFRGQVDIRSDIYALGTTLYEALALRPAFDDAEPARLMREITVTLLKQSPGREPGRAGGH
jgi:serine/threonine protein kinase